MPTPRTFSVQLEGFSVDVTRRRTSRASFRARPNGTVTASVPLWCTKRDAEALVRGHEDQIRRLRERALPSADKRRLLAAYLRLEQGDVVRLWGEPATVELRASGSGPRAGSSPRATLELAGGRLVFTDAPTPAVRRKLLERYLRKQLQERIPRARALAERAVGVATSAWTVRKMKTRWGSCRCEKRTVSISLELACHDPRYLELVAVHEVAHCVAPDHGPGFQAVMDRALPRWRELQRALDEEGMYLG